MKKFLMVLLSIAFVLNLTIVIGLIGGYGSPRRALYTITDELMNSAYRFKKEVGNLRIGCLDFLSQFSKIAPIKTAYLRYAVCGCCLCIKNANCYRRWTDGLSIFFVYWGCAKETKFFVIL